MSEDRQDQMLSVIQSVLQLCVTKDGRFDRGALGQLVAALALFVDDRIEQSVISGCMDEFSIQAAHSMYTSESLNVTPARLRHLSQLFVGMMDWTVGSDSRDNQRLLIDMVVDELIKRDRGDSNIPWCFDEETVTIIARAGTALMGVAKIREETEAALAKSMELIDE